MRKLVAALACRAEGSRLYGKPLQNLDVEEGVTILDHLVDLFQSILCIDGIVLGIAEGNANLPFIDFAQNRSIEYIVGDVKDVLSRLIMCGQKAQATDIFRVTTESPFTYFEIIDDAWERHLEAENDVTTVDGLPEGCHFEIYSMESLKLSHKLGDERHRSEYCSLYIREHRDQFKIEVMSIHSILERLDLRLTVDHPEDLVLCRHVYSRLKYLAPRIPLDKIINFLDEHADLQSIVAPFVAPERLWD